MFNKLFKRSALKVTTMLVISTVGLLGALFLGYQFGVFQRFIPNDATLLAFLGFIAAMFVWGIFASVIRGRRIGTRSDVETPRKTRFRRADFKLKKPLAT